MIDLFPPKGNLTTGQKIKQYRKAYKLSQSELAKYMGITQNNLSSIENDRREIGPKIAIKFCAIFNILIDDLLFPNGIENHDTFKEVRSRIKSEKLT